MIIYLFLLCRDLYCDEEAGKLYRDKDKVMSEDMLRVVYAEYLGGLSLKLTFSDGFVRILDFSEYLSTHPHPQHDLYQNPERFRECYIDGGNLVWGKDWDMIFPVEDLYTGVIK